MPISIPILLVLFLIAAPLTVSAPSASTPEPPVEQASTIAFVDATVLPMDSRRVLAHHTVVVRDGVIIRLGPTAVVKLPAGCRQIPGTGRFLLPGLADMHVHIDHVSDLELYPAYGVTTVLNLRGLPHHLRWREELAAGQRFGPTLYTSGDYMDGDPPTMQPMMSFDSAADAAASVVAQKRAGYDFIKVYAELSRAQLLAIGAKAQEEGIAIVGHTSDHSDLATVLRAGQVNLAHGEQALRYLDAAGSAEALAARLAAAGTTVTPNLALTHALSAMWHDLEPLLARPEARYLHPAIFQPFRRENNRYTRFSEAWVQRVEASLPRLDGLTRALHQAGVPLLVGTDSPVPGSYPGLAVWQELAALVAAGLDPYATLEAATANAGRFIAQHLDGRIRFGQVREGYRADLLLLAADPRADIAHIERQVGVMVRGVWHPQAALHARLAQRTDAFAPLDKAVRAFEKHLAAGAIEDARALFQRTRKAHPGAVLFSQYGVFFQGYGYLYGEGGGFHPEARSRAVALGIYEMYAETYPAFHSAHYMLGQAQRANGLREAAAASFRRALAIHPFYPAARRALAALNAPDAATAGAPEASS